MPQRHLVGVFYSVMFERDPVQGVDYIVDVLLPSKRLNSTSAELLHEIDAVLDSGESLTPYDMSEFELSDDVLRTFLEALRARLRPS